MDCHYGFILSTIANPTYESVKFLAPVLIFITHNEITFKDSFLFAYEVLIKNNNLDMTNFDVDSLFTNTRFIFL